MNTTTTEAFLAEFVLPAFFSLAEGDTRRRVGSYFGVTYEEIKEELARENAPGKNQQAGIFFTPNGEYQTKDARNKLVGAHFHYLVIDLDGCATEDESLMLLDNITRFNDFANVDPRFIVKTKRGFHVYYRFKDPIANTDQTRAQYRQLYIAVSNKIQQANADPSCSDISRLFRLPGYRYWKDNTGEYIISVIHDNAEAKLVDFHALLAALVRDEEVQATDNAKTMGEAKLLQTSDYVDTINRIPIRNVIQALGYRVTAASIWESADGPSDGWRIDIRGNYVTNFTAAKVDRPVGGCYSFALKHFQHDTAKTRQFFHDEFQMEKPKPAATPKDPFSVDEEDPITRLPNGKGGIVTINNKTREIFFINNKGQARRCSNFIIEPVGNILDDDGNVTGNTMVRLRGKVDTPVIKFPGRSGGISFADELKRYGPFAWELFDPEVVTILTNHIFDKTTDMVIHENKMVGFNKRHAFVTGETIVDIEKGVNEPNNYGFVNGEMIAGLPRSFIIKEDSELPDPTAAREQINKTFFSLADFYDPAVIFPLALTGILGLITPYLRSARIAVPYASLFGITQTGKTTISDFIKEDLLADCSERLSAASTTLLPLQESLRHGKAVFIGEFRGDNPKTTERLYGVLRDTFDGATAQRGTSSLSVVSWKLIGTVIIDGEHAVADPATFSRGLFLHCRSQSKRKPPFRGAIQPILLPLIAVLQDTFKEDGGADHWLNAYKVLIEEYRKGLTKKYEQRKLSSTGECSRIFDNYATILSLAHMIGLNASAIAEACDPSITEQLHMLIQGGAKSRMIDQIAQYISIAADSGLRFIEFPNEQVVVIKITELTGWLEITKKISGQRLESICQALNGETFFTFHNSTLDIHIDAFRTHSQLKDALLKYMNGMVQGMELQPLLRRLNAK